MIEVKSLTKRFADVAALENVSLTIKEGTIFGLIGSNGSGKSTLLRLMSGIYRADEGEVLLRDSLDTVEVFDNPAAKARIFYLSDDPYFFPHSTIRENAAYLSSLYPQFDRKRTEMLCESFGLDPIRKITTFSKGMQKQAAVILALSAHPDYLLCDETFDGLDPVMRQLVKRLLAAEVAERAMTVVVASHNLREIEDFCDSLALLHRTSILFETEMDALRGNLRTVQAAFDGAVPAFACDGLIFREPEQRGKLVNVVVRGEDDAVASYMESLHPLYWESIPLTLEEIFIMEMEERGYDAKHLIG